MKRHHGYRAATKLKRLDLGQPPGSPVYIGDRKATDSSLSVIGYDPVGSWTKTAANVSELISYRNPGGITWINVNGLKDIAVITQLAEAFGIHPLTVEDILNTEHRPKLEEFDEYLFITFKALDWKEAGQAQGGESPVEYEQISLILTKDSVITFQEYSGDGFDPIRRRIDANVSRIRKMGPDYLAYCIVDTIVDAYFNVLDKLGTVLEDFEAQATEKSGQSFMRSLQDIKQEILRMRRTLWPLRESVSALLRLESELITPELTPFLKDLHDNAVQAVETMESYREISAGILDVNLSSISNRMNEVMKVLTIISTIFIPLSFVAGVFGMNFRYMPELDLVWAYPAALGLMALIALIMILFFKKKHWW